MCETRRNSVLFGLKGVWAIAALAFCAVLTCATSANAQIRGRRAERVEQRRSGPIENVAREGGALLMQPLQTVAEVAGAAPKVDPSALAYEPSGPFPTASKNLTWETRDGMSYSALAFYPTTPPATGKFSAVIFSHGLGSSAESFRYLGAAWSSRGIVTIILRHPETDDALWRGKLRPMADLKQAYQKYWPSRDRARAIRSALDLLYSSQGEPGPLGADLDLSRVAVAGNDLGALAALMVSGQTPPDNRASLKDPRVAAVLALSPPVFCESALYETVYSGIDVPLMVVTGTNDDGVVGSTKAYQRRAPFEGATTVDRYLVTLQGADHRVYGGLHVTSNRRNNDAAFQRSIRIATTDFLAAYLQGEADTLLRMREFGFATPLNAATVEKRLGAQNPPEGAVDYNASVK